MACKVYIANKKVTPFESLEELKEFTRTRYPNLIVKYVKLRYEEIDSAYRYESPCYVAIYIDKCGDLRMIDEDGSFFFNHYENYNETIEKINQLFEMV